MATSNRKDPGAPTWKPWSRAIGSFEGDPSLYVAVNVVEPLRFRSAHVVEAFNCLHDFIQRTSNLESIQNDPKPSVSAVRKLFDFGELLYDTLAAHTVLPSAEPFDSVYGHVTPIPVALGPIWFPRVVDEEGSPDPWGKQIVAMALDTLMQIAASDNAKRATVGFSPTTAANIAAPYCRMMALTIPRWFGTAFDGDVNPGNITQPLRDYYEKVARGDEGVTHPILDFSYEDLGDEMAVEGPWFEFNDRVGDAGQEGDTFRVAIENPDFDPELIAPEIGDTVVVEHENDFFFGTVQGVDLTNQHATVVFDDGEIGEYHWGQLLPPDEFVAP